jgi:hypothetical protein
MRKYTRLLFLGVFVGVGLVVVFLSLGLRDATRAGKQSLPPTDDGIDYSHVPSQLHPGDHFTITWMITPRVNTTSSPSDSVITFRVLLVGEQDFQAHQHAYGIYAHPMELNSLFTPRKTSVAHDNVVVQIPGYIRPGRYELVFLEAKGNGSCDSQDIQVTISR